MQRHRYVKFIHFDFELDPLAAFQHTFPLTWVSRRGIIWYSWPNIKTMETCSMKVVVAFSICSWRLSNNFCVRGCFKTFFLLTLSLAERDHLVQYLPDSHCIPQHRSFKNNNNKKKHFSHFHSSLSLFAINLWLVRQFCSSLLPFWDSLPETGLRTGWQRCLLQTGNLLWFIC